MKGYAMFSTKTVFAAAALAAITVAGTMAASAAPIDRARTEYRIDRHAAWADHRIHHRHYVDRIRLNRMLAARHYRMIGDPYFLGGRYVVRTHDRFGRMILVRVDPWTGAYLGVVR
jgi:hypothetical protein